MSESEELAMTSFKIIAHVGAARSMYIEAVNAAKAGDFEKADDLFEKGYQHFLKGHDVHAELVQREAGGDPIAMTLMLAHAEDQLMSAESFKLVAEQLVDVYRRLEITASR